MTRTVRGLAVAALVTGAVALFGTGCRREPGEGTAETAGKKIDEAATAAKDAAKDTAAAAGEAARDTGKALEKAAEEAK